MSKSVKANVSLMNGTTKEIDFKKVYKYEVAHFKGGDHLIKITMLNKTVLEVRDSESYIKRRFQEAN